MFQGIHSLRGFLHHQRRFLSGRLHSGCEGSIRAIPTIQMRHTALASPLPTSVELLRYNLPRSCTRNKTSTSRTVASGRWDFIISGWTLLNNWVLCSACVMSRVWCSTDSRVDSSTDSKCGLTSEERNPGLVCLAPSMRTYDTRSGVWRLPPIYNERSRMTGQKVKKKDA